MAKAKKVEPKPVVKETPATSEALKPGFSNVAPNSPQATPYERVEPLPSQIT